MSVRRAGRASALAVLVAVLAAPASGADDYDPQEAGHPVRIVAYALHPVGVVLDWLIFRPAWWLGQYEPLRTLFGREPRRAPPEAGELDSGSG